jgi:protein-S-isoprenylcysteine O-methyltransferase Ste14
MSAIKFSPQKASIIVDAFLILLYILFIYTQISAFIIFHVWSLLAFVLSETIVVLLFFFRSKAQVLSGDAEDYVIAVTATLSTLLFRPLVGSHIIFGDWLVFLGIVLQMASLISLNTSFGVAPANRGIKTTGLYKFVRHPVYASYLVLYIGYVLNNQTWENLLIFVFAMSLQIWRIENEERLLSKSPEYKSYMTRARWKLIPLVF